MTKFSPARARRTAPGRPFTPGSMRRCTERVCPAIHSSPPSSRAGVI